jgi:hypothetical protein
VSFHGRFPSLVSLRVLDSSPPGPFPFCTLRVSWASPLVRRLASTPGRIKFLSYGPTDSLPVAPHPTFGGLNSSFPSVTQLPSAFNQSSVWLRGISPPFQMRSRAHGRRRLAAVARQERNEPRSARRTRAAWTAGNRIRSGLRPYACEPAVHACVPAVHTCVPGGTRVRTGGSRVCSGWNTGVNRWFPRVFRAEHVCEPVVPACVPGGTRV